MADLLQDQASPSALRREDAVKLERVELSDDEGDEDDFDYGGVPAGELDDGDDDDLNDEDLETALRSLTTKPAATGAREQKTAEPGASVKPSVIDDFIRNFLIKVGMNRTLDAFNTEWYELQSAKKLESDALGAVPDVYQRNQVRRRRSRARIRAGARGGGRRGAVALTPALPPSPFSRIRSSRTR